MVSWLGSFRSDDNWKWLHYLPCWPQSTSPHQNQRVHSFACCADFLVGVGVVPSLFFCEISGGRCKWSRTWSIWLPRLIRWLLGYASAFNLCSLVTDRYIAIVKPLKYVTCVTARRVIQMHDIPFLGDPLWICDDYIFPCFV